MTLDKEEHKQILLEIINSIQIQGNTIKVMYELIEAIESSEIVPREPG